MLVPHASEPGVVITVLRVHGRTSEHPPAAGDRGRPARLATMSQTYSDVDSSSDPSGAVAWQESNGDLAVSGAVQAADLPPAD